MKLFSLILLFAVPCVSMFAAAGRERVTLPNTVVPSRYEIEAFPDKSRLRFSATVTIDLEVKSAINSIELNAADLAFVRATLSNGSAATSITCDSAQQTAAFAFDTTILPGKYRLTIEYTGTIYRSAAGMFALDYETPRGLQRALFTQFENSDARRFVPSWDEPALKAVFSLTVTVPEAEMTISNMPISRSVKLSNGTKRVQFADTPRMSSYLLFFGLGDFERLSTVVNGVDIGVVVKRGDMLNAQFALDATAHILPYYEKYFGSKYPLPKLDLIAAPGSSQIFGAMENWGAILYFERRILIDQKISTQENLRDVYLTVAHETAHQWFGNLVTMAWWDDLWLNEGFASWMEVKATDHFHPEWKTWLGTLHTKEGAMRMDAKLGTHAIITPISDVLEANQAFDAITYQKGEAVIRMLETFLGEDSFRTGIQEYIKSHAYQNTVSDDLWKELEKTNSITAIAHDFTLQEGVPLVRVNSTDEGVALTADRFAVDASGEKKLSWHIPIVAKAINSPLELRGILAPNTPFVLPEAYRAGLVVNSGQSSYFRTLYDQRLMEVLIQNYRNLSDADQLGLLNDSAALGYAGLEPVQHFLRLASRISPDQDPIVLTEFVAKLSGVDVLLTGLPGRERFHAFARELVRPIAVKLGWGKQSGESQNVTVLRSNVLQALNEWNDPETVREAKIRFDRYLKDPDSLSNDLLQSVVAMVAYHADAPMWDTLHLLAKNAKNDLERERLYTVLGTPADYHVARRALELLQTDEVALTIRPWLLGRMADHFPDEVFAFVNAHIPEVKAMMETNGFYRAVPRFASHSFSPDMLQKLSAFAEEHVPLEARKAYELAKSDIRYNIELRSKRMPEVVQWLAEQPASEQRTPIDASRSTTKP